jgi:thiol-disulfide isomerase/thioredoxin
MKYIILFLSLIITQAGFAQDYPESLPDFKIFTLEGNTFNQNDIEKDTYTYFVYFNPTCGHCRTAFKLLNFKSEQIKKAKVKLYPVSANTEEETNKFFKQYAPNIQNLANTKILIDDDYTFADAFSVGPFPTSFLYDKNNKLVKVFEGGEDVVLFLNELN